MAIFFLWTRLILIRKSQRKSLWALLTVSFLFCVPLQDVTAANTNRIAPGNFGLPGIIDLPTAKKFPDGEIVVTQQLHRLLARSGISFQALPYVGFSFRYSGHGIGGAEAYGRHNHDRSFDAHISLFDEGKYIPAISIGLRDFIGTGWYSSEYIVGTKSFGNLELTSGLGFGRLAGKNSFSNPFGTVVNRFKQREINDQGRGGTLGTINWFHGDASTFYGLRYKLGDEITILTEYTPDLMLRENHYLEVETPWNFGVSYQFNDYVNLSTHYVHGNQVSVTASVIINPNRPPLLGGKELAPVPMRLRKNGALKVTESNEDTIRKVLQEDRFEIHQLSFSGNQVSVIVTNTKFRSTAQAIGRVASTLQRFTSDKIEFATIALSSRGLITGKYHVDLEKITTDQFNPMTTISDKPSITAIDPDSNHLVKNNKHFAWGVGPYFSHRLFNPDLPLSMEFGIEIEGTYKLTRGLELSGALRKSVLTNLTENQRVSNSRLPRVHSDWPLYDFEGQGGHIHELNLSYVSNFGPGLYGRVQAGLLEPFYAGFGVEFLYKPALWPIGIGIDLHRVRKRDYDMKFDLLN